VKDFNFTKKYLQYSLQQPIYHVKAARLIPPHENKPFRSSAHGHSDLNCCSW